MSFNFGATEFKYPPKGGFMAICQAPKDCTVTSGVRGGDKPQKVENNAPQAIIIEVRCFVHSCLFNYSVKDVDLRFH